MPGVGLRLARFGDIIKGHLGIEIETAMKPLRALTTGRTLVRCLPTKESLCTEASVFAL